MALSGRIVVVTGAARGIGRATAAELARRGARVALGDLNGDEAQEAAGAIGRGAVGLELDVADRESFERFPDAAAERLGGLDVVVNNAGIMIVGPLADAKPQAAAKVIEVNLTGVLYGMQLAVSRLRGGGQIVNVASASAWIAPPALAVYARHEDDQPRGRGVRDRRCGRATPRGGLRPAHPRPTPAHLPGTASSRARADGTGARDSRPLQRGGSSLTRELRSVA
jgi:nucleoside-diphosphate-sugar epimerase